MRLEGARILVTGGAGFIGSFLVPRLLSEGVAQVISLDISPSPPLVNPGQPSQKVRRVQGDITDPTALASVFREGVDGVFHMAVLPLPACTTDPRACFQINIAGTFNVIEAAQRSGAKKIVFSSASSVYGDTFESMDETHPLGARTMYGASKIAGEYLLRAFYETHKLDYVILRYMNVYGPGQSGGVIGNTLERIRKGLPPLIFGDGSQSFDFVYVSDVVEANIRAMASEATDDVFNIGSDTENTVKEVVYTLLELTGARLEPEFRPAGEAAMQRRVGSIQKAIEVLGYRPAVSLREGLQQVVKAYFQDNRR